MNVQGQIKEYISSQPEPKRSDMQELHNIILQVMPTCKLWFLDGKDDKGKIVSNPNIGYGSYNIQYADGTAREFYQIGLSANKTGISVYILGIKDKKYLAQTYGNKLGKASVSGYCIKFKTLKDIDIDILQAAIQYGVEAQNEKKWADEIIKNKTLPNDLSEVGKIEMPIAYGPLACYFGMFADKFGIEWMVDFDPKYNG